MSVSKFISSVQNPLIKKVLTLKEKSRERKKTGLFIIEGQRELELANKSGYLFENILFCPELLGQSSPMIPEANFKTEISKEVYEKIAHRGSTEGLLAMAHSKTHSLEDLKVSNNPLILVAEAPEKPGNIGALLRTADAANIDAVLIANPKGDLYNPNIIRSSVGCVFTTKIATGTTKNIITFLKEKKLAIYCAALSASRNYITTDFTQPSAIVVGTEATGLTAEWLTHSDQNIIIPMQGEIDSMNVSVSAAILIFEAKRQRGF